MNQENTSRNDESHDPQRKRRRRKRADRQRPQARPGRNLIFEPLEDRRLMVVTDFASITGTVFKDATGDGFTAGEQLANVSVQLFRDVNNNSQLDAGDGAALQATVSNASGVYRFNRLSAGNYFVKQPAQTAGGATLTEQVSSAITVTANAAMGVAGIPIDSFTTAQTVTAPFPIGTTANSTRTAPEAIGGERDMIGMLSAGGNLDSVSLESANNRLAFNPTFNATGVYSVVWDGPDGNGTVTNFTGLNGQDLTQGGTATHFEMNIGVDKPSGVARLRIFTNQTSFSEVQIPLIASSSQSYLIDFASDFQLGTGASAPATFTNVGAIAFQVEASVAAMDGEMTTIGSRGPTVITSNIDNFSSADISLTKTADTLTPNVGSQVTFTLTATNAGPDAATGVSVADLLPPNLTFVRSQASTGTYNSTTGVWSIGNLAVGAPAAATLTITANATSAAVAVNTAQVSAADQFDPDSRPNNNIATEDDQASVTVSPAQADLSLTKSVDNTAPTINGAITFTLEVRNAGPSAATNVEVTDLLPQGLSFSRSQSSQGGYNNATGVWSVGTVASGGTAQLQIVAMVSRNGTITNTAQVSKSDQADPDSRPNNNVATEDDQASINIVAQAADLSLTKSVDINAPNLNQNVTFTLTVVNAGPDAATGVEVTDRLPTGIAFVSITPPNSSYNSSTGVWSVPSIPAGGQSTLQITGTVTSVGGKNNTAEITKSNQFDPDSTPGNANTNEDDIASISLTPQTADLSLTKTASVANPNVGQSIVFNVVVRNNGPNTATNVVVKDTLGAGLTFLNSQQSQGDYNGGTGQWSIGSLASGVSATLQVTASVNSVGTKINTAEIIGAAQFDPDSTPNNNNPAEDDQASANVTPTAADLSLDKTVSNATPSVNETFNFVITVRNAGPDTATNVVVEDLLPAGLSFVSSQPSQGQYNSANGLWTVGNVPNAGSATLTLMVKANSDSPQTNTAQVNKVDQFDPDSTPDNDLANEDDQKSVGVSAQAADLSLTKTLSDPNPNVGDNITFTLTVRNDGPSAASGITIKDVMPNSLNFVSSTASLGSYNPTTGIWDVGQLGRSTGATLQIVGTVVKAAPFTNTAEITRSTVFDPDSVPDNKVATEDDIATVSVAPRVADLSLKKTVDDATPNVGQNVTFTVAVSNAGPDAATGVEVKDSLPAGASFVSSNATQGTFNRTTGIWSVGSIASAVTATLQLVVAVDDSLPQTNTAEITAANQFDPDSTPNNAASKEDDFATVSFKPEISDLSLVKTVDKTTPNIGDRVNFKLTVNNRGPSDATNVNIKDVLDPGLEFISFSASRGSYNPGTGAWTIDVVGSGKSVTLEIIATVTETGEKTNTAEVMAVDQFDPDSTPNNGITTEDDISSVKLTPQVADLSLQKTVNQTRPNVGENVTFTLTLRNEGPDAGTNVTVRDQLPAGLTFISAAPSNGVYNVTAGEWRVGTIPAGAAFNLTIVAKVVDSVVKTNITEVTGVDQFDPDSTKNNNIGTEDDQSSAVVTPLAADLSLVKLTSNPSPNVGDEVTFTLGVGNLGPDPSDGVVVMDILPKDFSFVRAISSQGTYTPETGRWEVGSVPVNVGASLAIVAKVNAVGAKTNAAEVIASNVFDPDSTPNNNNAGEDDQASVVVTPQQADLSLTKDVNISRPNVGDDVTFTITVRNAGPNAATGITVRDVLPPEMTFTSSTASIGSYNSGTGLWLLGSIPTNGTATLQIVAKVSGPSNGHNVAEIIDVDQADPDSKPNNNIPGEDDQDAADFVPQVVDVSIVKNGSQDPAIAGRELTYTLTVGNAGPSNATEVVVTDTLPAGVAFVSASSSVADAAITHTSGVVTAALGTLRPNETAIVTIIVRLDPATKGLLTNTAQIAARQFDSLTTNNRSVVNTKAILPPSTISGFVYIDMDQDGIKDPIETPIAGVKVTLEGEDVDGNPIYRIILVGSDGKFTFDNLQPGQYNITETQPTHFGSGRATLGTPGVGQVVNNDHFYFEIGQDQVLPNNNFGEQFPFLTRRTSLASAQSTTP